MSDDLVPVSMTDAVGYGAVDCAHETPVEDALVLKNNRLFAALDSHGMIRPPGHCALGYFQDDTRMLSHYALRAKGGSVSLLSAQVPRSYLAQIDTAVKDVSLGQGNEWDPINAIHLRRELLLSDRLTERLTVTNYIMEPLDYWCELVVASDFADIFEVRGWQRKTRGQFYAPRLTDPCTLVLAYRGVDGRLMQTVIRFRSPPTRLTPGCARWEFRLEPNECFVTEWEVVGESRTAPRQVDPPQPLEDERSGMDKVYDTWRAHCTRWSSDDDQFDAVLDRAVDDLRSLYSEVDGADVITAGIPWYSTVFGRDSLITSLQLLPLNPGVARDTLRYLAQRQGTKVDPATGEAPGKMLHELRRGEMARAGEIPFAPSYETVDATPLWLVLLHETWRWTGDHELIRQLLPNAERALKWIDCYGDLDGDGFVEYSRTSQHGLVNQGWKDSGNGVPYPDGTLPKPPIALVEVQGYVYDAKRRMSELYQAFGRSQEAERLKQEADKLRDQIRSAFWLEDLGTFALALDGEKNPLPTATTNAGHLLWSRVPTPEQAAKLARGFTGKDFFSGWGIRTLSAVHPVYNPMSYHDGSVWPHDNGIVILGLALYGHTRATLPAIRALHEAALHSNNQRLPELFCGMNRSIGARPVLYPVSCSPQAWASGSLFMMMQATLGLLPEAPSRVLHIRNPILPDFLDRITLTGLVVGGTRVALQFRRHGDRTLANLLGMEGEPLQLRIELS